MIRNFSNGNIKIKNLFNEINIIYFYFRPFIWFVFVNEFLFDFYLLEGESMLPTFEPYGNIVFVEKISNNKIWQKIFGFKKQYKRGEIVCAINPTNHNMNICKRIIYLEGDEVELKNGNKILIPPNNLWIEGDNKFNSMDSRKFGYISNHLILGRVLFTIWPNFKWL
jgi:signal peptidase I